MAFENEPQQRRSVGPAIAAAVVGVILGGLAAFGAGAAADDTCLLYTSDAADEQCMV